jgi:outer membrane lipoprotein SlyB
MVSIMADDKMKLRLQTAAQGGVLGLLIVGGIGLAIDKLWIAIPGALLGAYVGWCAVPS